MHQEQSIWFHYYSSRGIAYLHYHLLWSYINWWNYPHNFYWYFCISFLVIHDFSERPLIVHMIKPVSKIVWISIWQSSKSWSILSMRNLQLNFWLCYCLLVLLPLLLVFQVFISKLLSLSLPFRLPHICMQSVFDFSHFLLYISFVQF